MGWSLKQPPSTAPGRFLPAPNSSYWAIQWPRIIRWNGQSHLFNCLQEWICGIRLTAWKQPDGKLAVLGENLEDDYEYQYRFPAMRKLPWIERLRDTLPKRSAVDGFLSVTGFSRQIAASARKTGDVEIWTMGVPYYRGESLLWESPIDGVKIAKSMGLDTLFVRPASRYRQLTELNVRGTIDFLQREALDEGIEGWMLKADQGGSRFYTIRPVVSIFGKIHSVSIDPKTDEVSSIVVSMRNEKKQWKPMVRVNAFPARIPHILAEVHRLGYLDSMRVEIRANSIDESGNLDSPKFHRFAGKATDQMMELARFVSTFRVKPKWKDR